MNGSTDDNHFDVSSFGEKKYQEVFIYDLFDIIKEYRFSIFFTVTCIIALAYISTLFITPKYQATATLQIEQGQNKVVKIEDVYRVESDSTYIKTQYEVIKSRAVLERATAKLNKYEASEYEMLKPNSLNGGGAIFFSEKNEPAELEDDATKITLSARQVSVEPVPNTYIVKVNVELENPYIAANAANAIAEAYMDIWFESRFALTSSATEWMRLRLRDLERDVSEASEALQSYRDEEKLIDLKGEVALSETELGALTLSLSEARQDLIEAESLFLQVSKARGNERTLSTLPVVITNPLMQNLQQDKARLEQQVEELSRVYGPKHPEMIAARGEFESIERSIEAQLQKIVRSVETRYSFAKANEKSLASALENAREQAGIIGKKQFQLENLEKQLQAKRDLYDAFFTRIGETSATADLKSANASIIDPALPPAQPSSPNKKKIVLLAAIMSLLSSIGYVLFREAINNTVRTRSDYENGLRIPLLGEMPYIKEYKALDGYRLLIERNDKTLMEGLSNIRANIYLNSKDHMKVFSVVSSAPGEGRSMIAGGLGFAFNEWGRTLFVDCSSKDFDKSSGGVVEKHRLGLSDLLLDELSLDECIHNFHGLDILSAGSRQLTQSMIISDDFKIIMEVLKDKYRYIFLDSQLTGSFSVLLSQISDGVIYITEFNRLSVNHVSENLQQFTSSTAPVIGGILNKVKRGFGNNTDYVEEVGLLFKRVDVGKVRKIVTQRVFSAKKETESV